MNPQLKEQTKCPYCEGSGYDGRKRCMNCNGSGIKPKNS